MTKQHQEEDMKNYVFKTERANLKYSNKVLKISTRCNILNVNDL